MDIEFPVNALKKWFLENRRELPWRLSCSPYAVWISEVMLQQTQATVVCSYFKRWMCEFPTIFHLAEASLEKVIKLWEGLGYYTRARNLHAGAQQIVKEFGGIFPENPIEMEKIKGLGPYTIGAIRSFAFHHRVPAVDGNVMRVLARFYCIEEPINRTSTQKNIWSHASSLLPKEESWLINEALIELGATLCGRNPLCVECPLKKHCLAYRKGVQTKLPLKEKRTSTIYLQRYVGIIAHLGSYIVKKGDRGKVMADLYEFPFIDDERTDLSVDDVKMRFEKMLGFSLFPRGALPKENQTFTRYRVRLFPFLFDAEKKAKELLWKEQRELLDLPFSSGHRRILQNFIGKK